MIRKAMLICILLSFVTPFSYGQEKFSVSGELSFLRDGDMYIGLFRPDEWKDRREKLPKLFLHLKPDSEQKKVSKVSFKFDNVESGTYGIYAFQDLNGNGKQDCRTGVFSLEPCATFNHTTTGEWNEVKFDLKENINDIWFVLMSPEGTH